MAPRRCRSCGVLAPGSVIPVIGGAGTWQMWHLCGRCWGLLVLGLRTTEPHADLSQFADVRPLRLRPSMVHAAIQQGLRMLGRHTEDPASRDRDAALEQEEQLVAELQALIREVHDRCSAGVPAEGWRDIRRRIAQLRRQVQGLRHHYPGHGSAL